MEGSCRICGFLNPYFVDFDHLYCQHRREEAIGATFQDKVYPTWRRDGIEGRYSWHHNIEAMSPDWLRDELKRLFPETKTPPSPLFVDTDVPTNLSSNASRVLDTNQLLVSRPSKQLPSISPDNCPPVWVKETTVMSVQLQTASILVRNDNSTVPQYLHLFPLHNLSPALQPSVINMEVPRNLAISEQPSRTNKSTKLPHGGAEPSSHTVPIPSCSNETVETSADCSFHVLGARPKVQNRKVVSALDTSSSSDVSKSINLFSVDGGRQQQRCSFCFKNGETEAMVMSHNLFNPESKVVQCPILRAYRCETCHATGDYAHTRSYCPRVRMLEGNVRSATIALKSTRRQANGMIRSSKSASKVTVTKL